MGDRSSRFNRPRHVNERAKMIVDIATGEGGDGDTVSEKTENPAAVALGRLGGLKGGPARAKKLSSEERKSIARKAAQVRWAKKLNEQEK